MCAYDLVCRIAGDPFSANIPANNEPGFVQTENAVVMYTVDEQAEAFLTFAQGVLTRLQQTACLLQSCCKLAEFIACGRKRPKLLARGQVLRRFL
ncbi:hypothetical protein D3C71_1455370 [compost metagenome]